MTILIDKATRKIEKPKAKFNFEQGKQFKDYLREVNDGSKTIAYEFIGTDDFGAVFYQRQRYEVDAGRDSEPLLYGPIYEEIEDPNLPRHVDIDRLGPAAVIFGEIQEGGEVPFITVGGSQDSIAMRHYGVGLEYNKDIVVYNEYYRLPIIERQVGVAYNALLNHVHLGPFLTYSYTSGNQTPASAVGTGIIEHYIRTVEDAVQAAKQDTSNTRQGPYVLLISSSNLLSWRRAFLDVPQQGTTVQNMVSGDISAIIAYDGWSGTRGKKTISYAGVAANKAYLIDVGNRGRFAQSYMKLRLQDAMGNPDVSRFILEQIIWDTYFTAFVDVAAITEEITLPTS